MITVVWDIFGRSSRLNVMTFNSKWSGEGVRVVYVDKRKIEGGRKYVGGESSETKPNAAGQNGII
jgi:hypothetical protein